MASAEQIGCPPAGSQGAPIFNDVAQGNTYYTYVQSLAQRGVISGYPDQTFRPSNPISRGQLAKIMAQALQWPYVGRGTTSFADIPETSTFYRYIEAANQLGVVQGYACGGSGEPCDALNRPYFRPGSTATRGQIAKIVATALGFTDQVTAQSFEDVASDNAFYVYVERLALRDIMSGYACGSADMPCDPMARRYFLPSSNASRGQMSKIVYLSVERR